MAARRLSVEYGSSPWQLRSPQTTTAWLDDVSRTLTKSASSSKNGCDAIWSVDVDDDNAG